ncbi:hypothetical protein OSB04_019857 [Centaurea solstitialis]|uniref:Zinc finger, CCHC-type n=1 Tax=Centaurea solstitialis TaxID=347529 RepID=A0AA38SSS3_9ASTR|nr:hypothetical protein OSB04_019857 [Centaurea solstitialis]
MAELSSKDMTTKFAKLEKFQGVDFRRWQKKMHFLLTTLNVVHVLSSTAPEEKDDETPAEIRKRCKWENDDYICRGHILNGMSDSLFDIYQNVKNAKQLWNDLESKYIAEDASSKKFLVSDFNNYKMMDSRPVMEQYNELLRILGQYAQHNMQMDECIAVSSVIDKLPPSWKDFKHTLKHQKEELSLVQLGSHIRIEESLRSQESDKNKAKPDVGQPSVHMVEGNKINPKHKGKGIKRKFEDRNKPNNNSNVLVCWRCNMTGHLKRDCRVNLNKRGNVNNGAGSSGGGNYKPNGFAPQKGQNFSNLDKPMVYVCSLILESFYVQDDHCTWWIDSGATSHMCRDRRWFEKLTLTDDGSIVKMGDESTAKVCGVGIVNLTFTSGKTITLNNVLFVPRLRKNLVSGGCLNSAGFKQVYESDKFILSRFGTFTGLGYFCYGMFRLNVLIPFSDDNDCLLINSSSNDSSKIDDNMLWHARLGHVNFRRMFEMSKYGLIPPFDIGVEKCKTCMLTKITKQPFQSVIRKSNLLDLIHSDLCDFHATPSLGNKKYVVTFIDDSSRFCYVYLLHSKDEALEKFKIYKTEVELQLGVPVKCLRTDRGGEYMDPLYFQSVGIIHETTAPYTPQQNGVAERKNRVLKEMVNSMLSYSGLSKGFWGEAMLTACYVLNRVPNKRNKTTPYELWFKRTPGLNYFRIWGCRAVVKLTEPKRSALGERGVDCIFIGYAEHSKAYRFYVIDPNESVSVNTVIESRDAIFDEERFSSIPRPKDLISNVDEGQNSEILEGISDPEPLKVRKSKRGQIAKDFGSDFQLYLVEGSRDKVKLQYSYCYSIEEDPKGYGIRDAAFWKEAIDDELSSILENNTWVLSDLPPGSKPLGCKWIFKKKMKVDGTIDKFKARLVIQGFRQKPGIDYFDTYAPVARISTIRLLIALAAIHNLVVHQMDVKTAFLNGELDEEVYMKQPEGFVMPSNEHKVCKLVKSLYGLKQAPKQWHQKFDEVILSSGFKLNQSDKCVYSRFDSSGSGVIICLYVDDMLIFGTNQLQVDETKSLLSSKFAMKDMGEADVILGIRIKRVNKGIALMQSHYVEKILKKFNYSDCSPVSTPMDPSVKLMPNKGMAVSQLEYSQAIGCLMYAMTSTRPDIAYAVGRLSRYTSNPSTQHWQAIQRIFKYLKGTMDYGLYYLGYPSVLEGYSDASWITHVEEDHSSTTGWVFLLGGGAISWASKKQTCITNSTMESEFVALAAAGKEAEWLRNLIYEIPGQNRLHLFLFIVTVLPLWQKHIIRFTMGSQDTWVSDTV